MKKLKILYKIRTGLLLATLLFIGGCAIDKEELFIDREVQPITFAPYSDEPLVEFILNPISRKSVNSNQQIRKSLEYIKIPYGQISINAFNSNYSIAKSTKVLVITDVSILEQAALDSLMVFAKNGGTLVITNISESPKFGYLGGLKPGANYERNNSASGFAFITNFIPGFINKSYQNEITHFGYQAENFNNDVKIIAVAANNPNYPVIIENPVGKGQIISFNTVQDLEKNLRGLFVAAILTGLEHVPYPIANASSIFLDDFPSPVYTSKMEPIKSEFNLDQASFYTKVWWPDMLQLAKEENLKYAAFVCFDYQNNTNPPFQFTEWDRNKINTNQRVSDWLMFQVVETNHELAFHGYNHVSLQKKDWPGLDYMKMSLQSANKKWIAGRYGNLPITYVPPSNIIDSLGFVALQEVFPSIKYNSSLYLADFEDGGAREFDKEPYNDHFFNYPRIESGFDVNQNKEFNILSLYIYTGIWSHFVHPDDVYQIPSNETNSAGDYELRNKKNLGWRKSKDGSPGLLPRFKSFIKRIKNTYPMLQVLKSKDAASLTEQWRNRKYVHYNKSSSYEVASNSPASKNSQAYWFVYVKSKNVPETENNLTQLKYSFTKTPFLDGYLFNIKTPNHKIEIRKPLAAQKEEQLLTLQGGGFNKYLEERKIFELENAESVDKSITELKNKILNSNAETINKEDWKTLFMYLGWEDRTEEIWLLLDEKFSKNPTQILVELSKEYIYKSKFPDPHTQKRWMLRQSQFESDNIDLKIDYLIFFGDSKAVNLSTEEILKWYTLENEENRKRQVLLYLIHNEPIDAMVLLNDTVPCSSKALDEYAHDIAWLYANNEYFEKAIAWANCTTKLEEKSIDEWRVKTGEYEFLKNKNYPRYLDFLLVNDKEKALEELEELNPCQESLKSLYPTIVYLYAADKKYEKAIQWADCDEEIPFHEKLYWYHELGDFAMLESKFKEYYLVNPNNDDANFFMANYFAYNGQFIKGWMLASYLNPSTRKTEFQKKLNEDVQYITLRQQRFLLAYHNGFFLPETRLSLQNKLREQYGTSISWDNKLISDKFEPTSFKSILALEFGDKKENRHKFGVTNYNAFKLPQIPITNENNVDVTLYGVEYTFKKAERFKKLNYSATTGIEIDEDQNVFFNLSATASYANEKLFSSATLSHQPAVTGPAYNLDIYRTRLSIYEELKINKNLTGILYFEGSIYSDEVYNGGITAKAQRKIKLGVYSSIEPFAEASGSLGNKNNENSFPYWAIKKQAYAGMGLNYNVINTNSNIEFNLNFAGFYNAYANNFNRFGGSLKMPIFKHFYVNADAEFYTLKDFYSNGFNFGLKYYF